MSYNVISEGVVHSNHATETLAKAEVERVRQEAPWHDEDAIKYAQGLKVEEVTDGKCPVSLPQIFQAKFQPMTEQDYESFAGMEGEGVTAEIDGLVVILDFGNADEHNLQVHGPDGECWAWTISDDPVQIS